MLPVREKHSQAPVQFGALIGETGVIFVKKLAFFKSENTLVELEHDLSFS